MNAKDFKFAATHFLVHKTIDLIDLWLEEQCLHFQPAEQNCEVSGLAGKSYLKLTNQ